MYRHLTPPPRCRVLSRSSHCFSLTLPPVAASPTIPPHCLSLSLPPMPPPLAASPTTPLTASPTPPSRPLIPPRQLQSLLISLPCPSSAASHATPHTASPPSQDTSINSRDTLLHYPFKVSCRNRRQLPHAQDSVSAPSASSSVLPSPSLPPFVPG